ncbi:PDZ domain-containing protein [Pseudarcicella hirudinis]
MQLTDQNAGKNDPYLGADLRNGKISNVWRDSPAYNDGLNVGDEILTIDDTKLENLPAVIASKKVGDVISVKVKRDGLEKTYKVTLVKSPIQNFKIEPVASPSKEQQDLYKKWLFL